MAMVRASTGIDSIRGSLFGTRLSVKRTIGVAGVNRRRRALSSTSLRGVRDRFSRASIAWRDLSDANRSSWNSWADDYGHTADPAAPITVAGRARFIAYDTAAQFAGMARITSPLDAGVGDASPAFFAIDPRPGDSGVWVEMLHAWPTPARSPSRCVLSLGPAQANSRAAFKDHYRQAESLDLETYQPGIDGPAVFVDAEFQYNRGEMLWASSRTMTAAGNLSPRAIWPVFLAPVDHEVAFRILPLETFDAPHSIELIAGDKLRLWNEISGYSFSIDYDFANPLYNTVAKLAAAVSALVVWKSYFVLAGVASRPSTDLLAIPRKAIMNRQQPMPLLIAQ